MNPKIPQPIQPTLQYYFAQIQQQIPQLLTAFYIEGSIALGEFNEHFSDIDFVAILQRQTTPEDLTRLEEIHQTIAQHYPQWKLSGTYLLLDNVTQSEDKIKPTLHYHDGKLHPDHMFELQSVEGWILKNHGIPLFGPAPHTLPFEVDWDIIIKKMQTNLNTYWASWTRRLDGFLVMLTDWGIQWTVTGVLRQYYSFRENAITTKVKAAEYALTCVSARWHPLIQDAIHIRQGEKRYNYRTRFTRLVAAVKFLRFIIHTCNEDFA